MKIQLKKIQSKNNKGIKVFHHPLPNRVKAYAVDVFCSNSPTFFKSEQQSVWKGKNSFNKNFDSLRLYFSDAFITHQLSTKLKAPKAWEFQTFLLLKGILEDAHLHKMLHKAEIYQFSLQWIHYKHCTLILPDWILKKWIYSFFA